MRVCRKYLRTLEPGHLRRAWRFMRGYASSLPLHRGGMGWGSQRVMNLTNYLVQPEATMAAPARRLFSRAVSRLKSLRDAMIGPVAVCLLRAIRRTDPDRIADVSARLLRRVGPLLPEHRTGRANLTAAYPERSAAEIDAILLGVWDNLGRVAAEYAHLDRLWDFDVEHPASRRIVVSPESIERFARLRDADPPTLVFAAHLANWELPALAAAAYGVHTAILYRTPNIGDVAAAVRGMRAQRMGPLISTGIGAPSAWRITASAWRSPNRSRLRATPKGASMSKRPPR